MLKKYAFPFLFLILCTSQAVQARDKENVKAVMTSKWIGKYKKLKFDLENKAATLKEMEDLSEDDYARIRTSYASTGKKLEVWLQHLITTLEKADPASTEYFAKGELNPELENEFRKLGTFYANEFSTLYDEITGTHTRPAISFDDSDEPVKVMPPSTIVWKFDREELTASIQPLIPADWNSLN